MARSPIPWTPPAPLRVLDPPLCFGPRAEPLLDVPLLALKLRLEAMPDRPCVLLSDIPDEWDSLERGLALSGMAGAFAVGCGSLDVWLAPAVEAAAVASGIGVVRRTPETSLARIELRSPSEAADLWRLLSKIASG